MSTSRWILCAIAGTTIAACGGGGGGGNDLSGGNYAQDMRFSSPTNTNATTTRITSQTFGDATFVTAGPTVTGTVVTRHGTTATGIRTMRGVVTDTDGNLLAEEVFAVRSTGSRAAFVYTETSGDAVRTWNATSGTAVVVFRTNQQLVLRLENVRFTAVTASGATGSFTVNGTIRGETD